MATPEETREHQIHQLNDGLERTVEINAIDIRDRIGITTYSGALRPQIFASINVLSKLKEPELQDDLQRIKGYIAELLAALEADGIVKPAE
jgi:hypothetical protein